MTRFARRLRKSTWALVTLTFIGYYATAMVLVIKTYGSYSGACAGMSGGAVLVGLGSMAWMAWIFDDFIWED